MRQLAVLLLLSAAPAATADWVYVTSTDAGSVVEIDVETARREGNYVRLWVRYDLSKNRTEKAREAKERLEINCSAQTSRVVYVLDYAPDGSVMRSKDQSYASFTPIAPETVVDAIRKTLCDAPDAGTGG